VAGVDTAAPVSWSINDSAVAGMLEKHLARLHVNGKKVGNAVISASLNGVSGTFALVIQQAPVTNHPPVARIEGPGTAETGKAVSFNSKGSTDPDHDVLRYSWTFGDGSAKDSGSVVTHTFAGAATRTVTVVVTDPAGLADTASKSVTVTQAAPSNDYEPIDIGTLGGKSSRAADINNDGQIVGTSLTSAGAQHAFLRDASGMHDLGAFGHDGSEAVRINNSGVIAGTVWTRVYGSEDDNQYTCNVATIWRNGVGTAIDSQECRLVGAPSNSYAGFFADPFRIVRAMNGSADVTWASSRKFGSSGWLWQNGAWQQLPDFPMAINDRGQVVGARQTSESPLRFHAFLAEGAAVRDLGVLAPRACDNGDDCSIAVAMDINASGQVVGVSTDASGHYHFVLWDGAQIKDLGLADFASGQRTPVVFINDRGEIAGSVAGKGLFWSAAASASVPIPSSAGSLEVAALSEQGDVAGTILGGTEQHAFVWSQARGMVDLGTGGQGFNGAWVVDVNNRGDVVGYTAACVSDPEYSDNVCQNGYARNPGGITGGQVRAILWHKQ
jgi:probable HAF family extracellular repeat protein